MAATLDGRIEATGAVFEAKFMLPWSFSEEAAAEKYMPQLQHNMWVVAARSAVLSVITGGGKWVEITTHADPLYQHLIVTAERKFWRCVESGEPPRLFGAEPPKPRIDAVRIVDMSASNSWAEFAGLFRSTRQSFLDHERSKATKPASSGTKLILEPGASAALRDQLTAELSGVTSADDAANWAHRVIVAKNTLTTGDAERVEQAFKEKLASIAAAPVELPSKETAKSPISARGNKRRRVSAIDKTALALPVPRRIRSLLWRLRRATAVETGLFEIQAGHLVEYRQARQLLPNSRDVIHASFGRADPGGDEQHARSQKALNKIQAVVTSGPNSHHLAVELARCFLRLANLPNVALDRLSRYEATLWRQASQILYALEVLDRRKPQERTRRPFSVDGRLELKGYGRDEY